MKVIIIKGKSNVGKTTTIRHIFETLIESGAEVKNYNTEGHLYTDFFSTLEYKGKRIAINSLGDLITTIRGSRDKAIAAASDIFITAWTSTLDGKNYMIENEFPSDGFTVKTIEQDALIPINTELKKQTQDFCYSFISDNLD